MPEVNVRKWHEFIFSSHFSNKIGHVKIKLETTLVLGYLYTACSGRCRPFCIFIRWESCENCKYKHHKAQLWS